jgi:hypothetical protein
MKQRKLKVAGVKNVTLKMPKEMHAVLSIMAKDENTTVELLSLYIIDNILRGVLARATEQAQQEIKQEEEETK